MYRWIKDKRKKRNEAGLTLIELIVGMAIMGLIGGLMFAVFQSTNTTATSVQGGTTAVAAVQTATLRLGKAIRNAVLIQVSADGTRLNVEKTDGTCASWVFNGNVLYSHYDTTAPAFSTSWTQSVIGLSLPSGGKFFNPLTSGASYTFQIGTGVGAVAETGSAFMRILSTRTTSPCYN